MAEDSMIQGVSPEPKISVVMAVCHNDDFLELAISSILRQSFTDYEFLIICDDPSNRTKEIFNYYENVDSRIKIFYGTGTGLVDALNIGCRSAKGKYIARMDADDISVPDRFEKQIAFLENNSGIGVCGSWMEVIDKSGKNVKTRMPPSLPKVIHFALMFNCCIAQPTVIMRRDIVKKVGFYREAAFYIEDYDLWARLCCITQIANIPEFLIKYRYHGDNISKLSSNDHFDEKMNQSFEISIHLIRATLGNQFDTELQSFFKKWKYGQPMSVEEVVKMEQFIERLSIAYQEICPLNAKEKNELSHYQGFLLLDLAFRMKNVSRWKAFEYVLKAIRLDPSLLVQFPGKIRFARLSYNA